MLLSDLALPPLVFLTARVGKKGVGQLSSSSISSTFLRDISRFIAPMILFIGGVWLLSLRIPGWSILFGLPAIQIGIVLVILSFDNSAKKTFSPSQFHIVKCEICGDPTAAPLGETHEVCPRCRLKRVKSSFFRGRSSRT